MEKKKISIEKIKKIPVSALMQIINRAKKYLKKDDVWKELCKEYDEEIDIIDYIPTMFGDIDTSAKTDHGIVILNYKLLSDGDFFKDYSYLIHEYTHWFQQCYGDKPTKGSDDGNYLKNPFEQEGFQNQIEYIDNHFGENKAEDYVNHLLNYHDVGKKEKNKLEDVLMEKCSK